MLLLSLLLIASPASEGWEEAGRQAGVIVYLRAHGDGPLQETLAIGAIDAPPWVVKNAIDDFDAKDGAMPYLKENRIIARDDRGGALIYHRTAPPLVTDRDYTIRMFDESFVRGDGSVVYVTRWRAANDEGPPVRSGVVRVLETEGYWRLEPIGDGKKTRASYFVFADAGGMVPRKLVELGTTSAIGGIFDAIRDRAHNPKYAVTPPRAPTLHKD